MAEENKDGIVPPSPASGDDGQGKQPENADKTAELEDTKRKLNEAEGLLQKKDIQISQAGHNIENLKRILKENGVEVKEGDQISLEDVEAKIIGVVKPLQDEIASLKTNLSEMVRAKKAEENLSPDGGGAGQVPPISKEMAEPELSEEDKKLVTSFGGKWDGAKKGWATKSGRFIPFNDLSGIAAS